MDSPYAVEAIRGMGLDPEQIALQADEARAQALAAQQQHAHDKRDPEPGPSV